LKLSHLDLPDVAVTLPGVSFKTGRLRPPAGPITEKQKERKIMPVKNSRELFALMLSDVRQSSERMTEMLSELSDLAEDPLVTDALEESEFVAEQNLAKLDQCFKLIGEKPVKLRGRVREVLFEEVLNEASDIISPSTRQLYIVSKAIQLIHFRIAEYTALIAASEITGNQKVRELLESVLADNLTAVERARRLIRKIVEVRIRERSVA
jgi:ferritin-like metal-binding protein YciE